MKLDLNKIKSLIKDDKKFEELLKLLQGIEREPLIELEENFNDFFWFMECADQKNEICYSDGVKNITGYSSDELNNLPGKFLSIVNEDDLGSVKRKLAEFERDISNNKLELNYRILTKENKTIWLKHNILLKRDQMSNRVISNNIIYDISPYKIKESEQHEALERFKELNAQKDRFISIVSHDLRAPFTSLLGFSEILLNEPDLPAEERREYLDYIYDASNTQLQLINYLLDWSKLQTGRLHIEQKRLNLRNLIQNCKSVLTGAAIRKSLEIKTDIPKEIYVNADERLMTQVVTNLISNAIKFTPKNKKVYISANKFKEGMIEVIFRDEGVGLSEENQIKLFKIDQKFSMEGTGGEKGTGLGLTLVNEIIEKHGGDIWFYSKLNEGSEFHITLPEAKNVVLLVEDDVPIRSLFVRLIKKTLTNFEVIEADNGYEAMSVVLNQTPSLVITDHAMPLMNGIQLVEAMRKKDINKNVPVIVISAQLNNEVRQKYLELGVEKLISKPIDYSDLAEIIKESVN